MDGRKLIHLMPSDISVNFLVESVARFRDERGWTEGHSPDNLAKSIFIEAAELLELFQWHPPGIEILQEEPALRENVAEELADVLLYALSMAERINLDVSEIVLSKLTKNAKKYPLPA